MASRLEAATSIGGTWLNVVRSLDGDLDGSLVVPSFRGGLGRSLVVPSFRGSDLGRFLVVPSFRGSDLGRSLVVPSSAAAIWAAQSPEGRKRRLWVPGANAVGDPTPTGIRATHSRTARPTCARTARSLPLRLCRCDVNPPQLRTSASAPSCARISTIRHGQLAVQSSATGTVRRGVSRLAGAPVPPSTPHVRLAIRWSCVDHRREQSHAPVDTVGGTVARAKRLTAAPVTHPSRSRCPNNSRRARNAAPHHGLALPCSFLA
jgi:hypothetical protein